MESTVWRWKETTTAPATKKSQTSLFKPIFSVYGWLTCKLAYGLCVRLAFKFHLPVFQIHAGKTRGWSWPLTQDRSREQYWLYVATIAVLGPSMLVDHFFRVLALLRKTFICFAVSVAGQPVAWDLRNIWQRMLGWLLIRQVLISP